MKKAEKPRTRTRQTKRRITTIDDILTQSDVNGVLSDINGIKSEINELVIIYTKDKDICFHTTPMMDSHMLYLLEQAKLMLLLPEHDEEREE